MKKNKKIAVLPGDGIGPEVMKEALKVLEKVKKKYGLNFELKFGDIGGIAIDKYDHPLPEQTKNLCLNSDAVLLGSIGGPKWDNYPPEKNPEIGGLLGLRKLLNLYVNLRPVVLYERLKENSPLSKKIIESDIDIITVRELSQGIYFSKPKKLTDNEGYDTMRYDRQTVNRISKSGFEIAKSRRRKITSVDKANVLYSSKLWRKTVSEISRNYPEVELTHMYVDNAAMQLILNPSQFDVILTTNLFGDILSDESAAISGSLGMIPSASFGKGNINLYEPAGGSAPDIAGKGIANPVAQILSLAMMLEYSFGLKEAANDVREAVKKTINEGYGTIDIVKNKKYVLSTSEMGDSIAEKI